MRELTRSHSFSKSITMKSSKHYSNCSIFKTEVLGALSSSMDDATRSSPRHVLMESPQKPQSPLSAMLEDNQKSPKRLVLATTVQGSLQKHPPTARLAKRWVFLCLVHFSSFHHWGVLRTRRKRTVSPSDYVAARMNENECSYYDVMFARRTVPSH
jgi:hypothetical protein